MVDGHLWNTREAPALTVGGVDGLRERDWEGRRLQIGEAVIALEDLASSMR
jgi:hypothetical protein